MASASVVAHHRTHPSVTLETDHGVPSQSASSWDGAQYAQHTAHHRAFDHLLVERIGELSTDAYVIDIGCGAGDLTRQWAARVPDGMVLGIDADESMIRTAGSGPHLPHLLFRTLPAQRLAEAEQPGRVDAIVSTACLHWIPAEEQPALLASAWTLLRPGGLWCVEFGGVGQLAEVRTVLDPLAAAFGSSGHRWFFPSASEYAALLTAAGFVQVETALVRQQRVLAGPGGVAGWLTSQVLMAYRDGIPSERWPEFVEAAVAAVTHVVARTTVEGDQGLPSVPYVRVAARAVRP
ncbi:MAG TPA: hypothetical protein DCM51_04390 [Actinobacteria bacterium]|nr:hypothetical protein [Actinomycetota bacterium]